MATKYHNISGALTKELLAVGDGVSMSSISIANTHSTDAVSVDLFIKKKLLGNFYFFKSLSIPAGVSLVHKISFQNTANEFSLNIKLSAADSTADVMIS
tara:strand:+ start:173 stop:469 length:297 start_codon:yes stop_codon:yes gene_type:complete